MNPLTVNRLSAQLENLFPPFWHNRIFVTGGTVRDFLLGSSPQDLDLAAALPEELLQKAGFRLVTAKTATRIWFLHLPEIGKIEITRLDTPDQLHDDLLRRDFTINAIAISLSGELIDPLGGQDDLVNGLLRLCSDNAFTSDPLRIFRGFRFEAHGFKMTAETEQLARQLGGELVETIPTERITGEMLKALSAKVPERFFEKMVEFGVGRHWLPELFRMPDIPAGPIQYHPEGDLLTHSVEVLQRTSAVTTDPLARFCGMFHDIGKLATNPALYPKHHGHDEAGFGLAVDFCNRLCLPVEYRKALAWISRLHGKLNRWDELRDSTKLKMADQAIRAGIQEILPVVSMADKAGGRIQEGWGGALSTAALSATELGIDLEKLGKIAAGKRADYILQKQLEWMRGTGNQLTETGSGAGLPK